MRDFVLRPAAFVPPPEPKPLERPTVVTNLLGLDLGKTRDPSAMVLLRKLEFDTPGGAWREVRYEVPGVKRWPLNTEYPDIMKDTRETCTRFADPILVLDASGVGRPMVDYARKEKLPAKLIPVVIVGGMSANWSAVDRVWHVSKQVLVVGAQLLVQQGRVNFAKSPDLALLLAELVQFRVEVTKSGSEVYSAREGEHDDLVMAFAIALWWAEYKGRRFNLR